MLAEDDNGAISRKQLHKDAHGAKEMQLELSRQMFYCDDVKGFLTMTGTLVMVSPKGGVKGRWRFVLVVSFLLLFSLTVRTCVISLKECQI